MGRNICVQSRWWRVKDEEADIVQLYLEMGVQAAESKMLQLALWSKPVTKII